MSTSGFYGDRFNLLMGVQADFATENTADHIRLPLRSLAPDRGRQTSEASLLGQGRNLPNKTHKGLISPSVNITVPIEPVSIGYHLTGMFGAPTTTSGSPNQHNWQWNEIAADPPFYTVGLEYRDRAGSVAPVRYGKAIYNSMELAFGREDGPLDLTFGLLAARVVENVPTHDPTPTAVTMGEEFRQFQTQIFLGDDVDTLTRTVGISNFRMSVTRNASHNHTEIQNSSECSGFLPGDVTSITGSMSLVARENGLRTLATAFDPIKMLINMRPAGASQYLNLSSDLLLLDEFDWQAAGLGLHTADVNFRIQQPGVDPPGTPATPLVVNLFNAIADYNNFLPA